MHHLSCLFMSYFRWQWGRKPSRVELLPLFLPPPLQSAVTCLLWPAENIIVFGLAEGKVEKLLCVIFFALLGLPGSAAGWAEEREPSLSATVTAAEGFHHGLEFFGSQLIPGGSTGSFGSFSEPF